jgi:mRNA-degrading endonuclease RelE of RelBE toxin-antitoxin system
MAYEIEFLPSAEKELNELPAWLQAVVEGRLQTLADSPSNAPDTWPARGFRHGGMVSQIDHGPIDGTRHYVSIFFGFSEDEKSLIVTIITHHEFEEDATSWPLH